MQIEITFKWGERNVTPPRCRKPRTVDRTDRHTVTVPAVTADEAPIALRAPHGFRWADGETIVDYRWYDDTLWWPALENISGRPAEQMIAGSSEFPFEVERTGEHYSERFGIPWSADALEDAIASIDAWWGQYLVIDGLVWERAFEPRYAVRSWSRGQYSEGRRVEVSVVTESRDLAADRRVYAATDIATVLADANSTARRRRVPEDFGSTAARIEVLIPAAVRVQTTPYFEAMGDREIEALRGLVLAEHVREEDADEMVRRVVGVLVEREGFAGAQGALRTDYHPEWAKPSAELTAAMLAAGVTAAEEPQIVRTTFTFTVLHPAGVTLDDIRAALHEAEGGDAVGLETGRETIALGDALVPSELIRLGNDGRFFDSTLVAG